MANENDFFGSMLDRVITPTGKTRKLVESRDLDGCWIVGTWDGATETRTLAQRQMTDGRSVWWESEAK